MKTMTKPKLRFVKKVVYEVGSDDFEDFIKEVYGQFYDFTVGEDLNDNGSLTFDVMPESLNEQETADLVMFKKTGEGNILAHLLLTDMCNKNLVPSGEFLIYAE